MSLIGTIHTASRGAVAPSTLHKKHRGFCKMLYLSEFCVPHISLTSTIHVLEPYKHW